MEYLLKAIVHEEDALDMSNAEIIEYFLDSFELLDAKHPKIDNPQLGLKKFGKFP